jgi:branched-chain amino acid transport system substrate-binding protein
MTVKRRDFVAGTAAILGSLAAPRIIRAQSDGPIVILGLWPLTGAFADFGPLQDRGAKLAVEEWGGQVIGRPIKYITRDDETKAASATRRVEEAIDSENAKFVVGPFASAVALSVTEIAKRRKVLYFFAGGTEEIAGKRCHRYGFQWAASPYTAMHVVADKFMALHPKAKRWYLFVADNAFGVSLEKYLRMAGQEQGIEFVGADRIPLGNREYSSFISKAAAAKPDVLGLCTAGQDSIQAISEAHNFGLAPKVPVVFTWGVGMEKFAQLDAKTRENMWVGTNAYFTIDTPIANRFNETYQKQYKTLPGYAPISAYAMVRLILRGIEKAKSGEPADVVRALEGWETDDWSGKVRITSDTHQTVREYFLLRAKKSGEMKNPTDYAEVVAGSGLPIMPADINECKDIGTL